jgi:Asp/Glu/hydantoin racemase
MKSTSLHEECNPLELEAQADDLEAEALRLRAMAKRRRAAIPVIAAAASVPLSDLDEHAAADVVGVSIATFRRAKVDADYFAGTRPRWRDAESVRAKFAARGKAPTTPSVALKRASQEDDLSVDRALSVAGLRRAR